MAQHSHYVAMLTAHVLLGVLFDNHEDWSCAEPTVDLQHSASMRLAGLWLCIKDSLHHSTQLPASFHTFVGSKVRVRKPRPLPALLTWLLYMPGDQQ